MSYFPNNIVPFQVPVNSTFVGQSFPNNFYNPFESQHTDFHHLSSSPTKTVEKIPPSTRRFRGRPASSKGPGHNKSNGENKFKQKADETSTADYIHVRARRGQATDSHSLAERVRREKISERMLTLQSLVPGCDKVTGKALKLDQIINYIQSLQTQVQYLSMKLASISSIHNNEMRQDHTIEELNVKEHDSQKRPIMDATTLTEHQLLENSNLFQQVETLFAQDRSDEVLTWDLDDNVIDFETYEQLRQIQETRY